MVICGITSSVRFSELILKLSLEKWNSPTVAWSGGAGPGTDVSVVTRADAPWEFSMTATPDVAASAATKPLSTIARFPMCLPPDRRHPGPLSAGPVTLRGPSAPTHREEYVWGTCFSTSLFARRAPSNVLRR
jgi:hypothetical protein